MRVVILMLAASLGLAWFGVDMRAKDPHVSILLFTLSGLLACLLVGALFGLGA